MGACMSTEPSSGDVTQALVVDVQKVIADYVWKYYTSTRSSWWNKALKRKDFTVEVPMCYFHFHKTGQEVVLRNQGGGEHTDDMSKQTEKLPHGDNSYSKGLQTHYRNDTDEVQTYNFNFEKTRRTEARVSQSKGFSFGGKTDFSVNLPKILPGGELGAELDMHMEITKTEEQTFEKTSTTRVTSEVSVSPKSHCVVNVILEDNHFKADYKVYITMEMPSQRAEVKIRNKKGEVIDSVFVDNLSLLFPEAHHIKNSQGMKRGDAVQFVVQGVISGTQMSNQRIQLDSHPLEEPFSTETKLID